MENQKQEAIKLAVSSLKKAKTYGGRVGACIYTKTGKLFLGFNVETKIHKGYHAEEVAIINSLINESKPEEATGVIIVCELDNKGIFPACASCRQFLWEFTNPDLLVTVVNTKGEILFEDTLTNLYPMPYPTAAPDERKQ
jgi:cytidine deaminase